MKANLNLAIFLSDECSVSTNECSKIYGEYPFKYLNLDEEGESNSIYFYAVLVRFHSLKKQR